jgi:hypothetical protein
MKSIRKISLLKVLLILAGAMAVSAVPVHAQTTKGTFTLTHKVRWGTAVLPAGNYVFSVDTQTWPARVMVHEVDGPTTAIILPQASSDQRLSGESAMLIQKEDGESVVSSLRLANVGLTLEFYTKKDTTAPAETATLSPIADARPGK